MGAGAGRGAGHPHLQVSAPHHHTPTTRTTGRNQAPHPAVVNMESNNNVAGLQHEGRLYLAWRTAPLHFAGPDTRIHLVSSPDDGVSWDWEATLYYGRDLREPLLLSLDGRLVFSFFQGGTNPVDFEPFGLFRMTRLGLSEWTEPELWGEQLLA